jgi:CRP-like cAMP-binding protein
MAGLLDVSAVTERLKTLPVERFAAGATILAAGTRTGRLLILEEGKAEVLRDGVQVGELTEPGVMLGEMAVLLDAPHTADVLAITDCVCRVGDAAAILRNDPQASLWLATVMARRLDATNQALVDIRRQVEEGKPRSAIGRAIDRLVQARYYDSPVDPLYTLPYF